MTKEDIIRMAREVGAGEPESLYGRTDYIVMTRSEVERFAALVADAEREACAKLVEDWDSDSADPRDIAAAIRARGQDPMPLFDDWGGIPYKSCPPCNQQCNQGRDCPNA